MRSHVVVLLGLASAALGQVTLQPSTIRTGRPGLPTITVTATKTETLTETETETLTETESYTTEVTTTATVTETEPCTPVSCPTLTRTATACATCLIPQCTKTVAVEQPKGCATLPTATVSFPCSDKDSCGKIGCKTVYDIKTAA